MIIRNRQIEKKKQKQKRLDFERLEIIDVINNLSFN